MKVWGMEIDPHLVRGGCDVRLAQLEALGRAGCAEHKELVQMRAQAQLIIDRAREAVTAESYQGGLHKIGSKQKTKARPGQNNE